MINISMLIAWLLAIAVFVGVAFTLWGPTAGFAALLVSGVVLLFIESR